MERKELDRNSLEREMDWEGNNAAFTCPSCAKVFIVSAHYHNKGRDCPSCGKSRGYVFGGKKSGGTARLEWATSN